MDIISILYPDQPTSSCEPRCLDFTARRPIRGPPGFVPAALHGGSLPSAHRRRKLGPGKDIAVCHNWVWLKLGDHQHWWVSFCPLETYPRKECPQNRRNQLSGTKRNFSNCWENMDPSFLCVPLPPLFKVSPRPCCDPND